MNDMHICTPTIATWKTALVNCPTCGRETSMIVEYLEWYGDQKTCLECGDVWADGERERRPIGRNAKKIRYNAARERLAYLLAFHADKRETPVNA